MTTGTLKPINHLVEKTEQAFAKHKNQIIVYVVLGTLAALAFSISAWANINIAHVYGTSAILKHSVYTILLPLAVTVLAVRLITFLFRPLGTSTPANRIELAPITTEAPRAKAEEIAEMEQLEKESSAPPSMTPKVSIQSPFPGKLVSINVKIGDLIKKGDLVFTIETMKMHAVVQADVKAQVTYRVTDIVASPDQVMEKGNPVLHCEEVEEQ